MSFASASLPCRHVRVAAAAVLVLLTPGLAAQEISGAAPADPSMVIARTVEPRIAYRGIPIQQNPIHTEATLFPSRAFDAAIDGTLGELLGDDALGARGSAGVHSGAAVVSAITGELGPLGGAGSFGLGQSAGASPVSPGAGVGGAVRGGSGGGLGSLGSLIGSLPAAVLPNQQGGGP